MTDWLEVHRGDAPLLLSFPHTGTFCSAALDARFVSAWQARRDTDWWIDELYAFARDLGATIVRTTVSRTVIDVNRDPSGASLYPGQATTGLCPTTDFDGAPLYAGSPPDTAEIAARRTSYFDPYHRVLTDELNRLRSMHETVVLYDAHSIRSHIPRLFEGRLPHFNIGTNGGTSCDVDLARAIEAICAASGRDHVLDGRFKGGWTTRHYGRPSAGIHAIQMELAMHGYMAEPETPTPDNWPTPFDADHAGPMIDTLRQVLSACLVFARKGTS